MSISIPTIKSLKRLKLSDEDTKLIRQWFEWRKKPSSYDFPPFPESIDYRKKADFINHYTIPDIVEAVVAAIITEGRDYSFEIYAPLNQDKWKSYSHGPEWSAVNAGDPYVNTIIKTPSGNYRVACWGDIKSF